MKNSQLLITFTHDKKIELTLKEIQRAYSILFNKIFVLENEENKKEFICSYNIDMNQKINDAEIPQNTIGVHRKKSTNTLYTINALNYLITALNDGTLDTKFPIPWDNYKNCILVTNGGEFKKIKTVLNKIIEI